MKKLNLKKSLMAAMVCLGVASFSTSAFAASTCPIQPAYGQYQIVYKWNWMPLKSNFFYYYFPSFQMPMQAAPAPVAKPQPAPAPAAKPQPVAKPQPAVTVPVRKPVQATPVKQEQTQAVGKFASEVAALVNQERAKAGLQPLRLDSNLSKMALDKAKDMHDNNYFDHTSPTYGSPFEMMKKYGISYTYAGENIAMGQRTPQEVMNGWMNSPGHRANILNPNFNTIGVAYYNGYWVQEFIRTAQS
ncbi:CAP domain-containing protein [Brevibacillus sp. H7]|uniref:CAP domain-containing protein n=1 Tax=Brevibacillus sp. H7 TaxID=3349138 RepID=UPI00381F05BE